MLPADLTKRLQPMARFRNLLVHMYWKIDYDQVYEVIQFAQKDAYLPVVHRITVIPQAIIWNTFYLGSPR